jgi:hypothetical protein
MDNEYKFSSEEVLAIMQTMVDVFRANVQKFADETTSAAILLSTKEELDGLFLKNQNDRG